MANNLRQIQCSTLFRQPTGLPESPPTERTLPNSGTNISSFFGEDALAVLQLTEEELEIMVQFRVIPLDMLQKTLESAARGASLEQISFIMTQQIEGVRRIIQMLKTKQLSTPRMLTLHKLAIAEKTASQNIGYFHQFCQNLKGRYTSLPDAARLQLLSTIDLISDLESLRPREQFVGDLSEMVFGNTSSDKLREVIDVVGGLLAAQSCMPEDDLVALASTLQDHTDQKKSEYVAKIFGTSPGIHGKILGALLRLDTAYPGESFCRDADLVRFLFGLSRKSSCNDVEFLNMAYSYVTEYTAQNLSTTPAELVLSRVLSHIVIYTSGYLLLCTLTASHIYSFVADRTVFVTELLSQCCHHWRNTTQLGELFGTPQNHAQQLLTECMDQIFLGINTEAFTKQPYAEALQCTAEHFQTHPESHLWAYKDHSKPWLPQSPRSYLSSTGTLSMVKADTPLVEMHNCDLWLPLKWAGLDVSSPEAMEDFVKNVRENSSHPEDAAEGLVKTLLRRCTVAPEQHSKTLALLLTLSPESKPLFFGSKIEEDPPNNLTPPSTAPSITTREEEDEDVEDWPEW